MTLTLIQRVYIGSACTLIVFGLGFGTGWKLTRPKIVQPIPAPAIRQTDGSLVLQVKPDGSAKPDQQVPAGGTVIRIIRVKVQDTAQPSAPAAPAQNSLVPPVPVLPQIAPLPCPPVEVDLTLVRMPDGSQRVLASSPDGHVLDSSMDIPVENVLVQVAEKPRRNTLGISYDVQNRVGGIWYDYKLWRVTVGAEVNQVKQTLATGAPTTTSLSLRVGWQF